MNEKLKGLREKISSDWEKVEEEKKSLVQEFLELTIFLKQKGMPKINDADRKKIANIVGDTIGDLQIQIATQYKNIEHKEILITFVSRFNHHVDVIATHNALSRRSTIITEIDYQNSLELLQRSYHYLTVWVEENIEENITQEKKREVREVKLRNIFKRNARWKTTALRTEIMAAMSVGQPRAYQLISDWVDNSMLIKTTEKEEDYYELRGGTK